MFTFRTFCSDKMFDMRFWIFAATLHALLVSANGGSHSHRRSTGTTQGSLSASKNGWRPVVGSSGLLYGSYGTAPLHAPGYKVPIPVQDVYQSSSRPLVTKDATKLTSIAQSYRPTTLRTVSTASTVPANNQPINTYHNPFNVQTNSFQNYKFLQGYPTQSILVRNTYNPYIERPVFTKIPNKLKQNNYLQNAMLQQLTNIQPYFGQYLNGKPLDLYGKPIENYVRHNDVKKQPSTTIETFKPEVFKLDNDAAPQSLNQQVKTIQQQGLPNVGNPYPQYSFQDAILPPSILGSFGTFGIQSLKGRDPAVFHYPTTFGPSQATKQTIFNSFSYSPNFKTTPTVSATTPRAPTTVNQIHYGTTYRDFKIAPTPQTKVYVPPKIDPNANIKTGFIPSPYDPFSNKNLQSDFNKVLVTTYNPSSVQTTTLATNYYDYGFGQNLKQQAQNYQNQQIYNYNYEKKKHKIHDSVAAGNQQLAPTKTQSGIPQRPSYEVVETTEPEYVTQSSPAPWLLTSQSYDFINHKVTEQSPKKEEFDDIVGRPGTTPVPDLPEEFAIVTEADKGHDNSLNYDSQVESQSRRPLGDDFEPIVKHKLKDYYYKVSTPNYDNYSTSRRTKKPTEPPKYTSTPETTTLFNNNKENNIEQVEALPTLPPNQHFRRPGSADSNDNKDKIRKRTKIRRRRPPLTNINRFREESPTRLTTTTVSTTDATPITEAEEVYTIRPRVRPTKPSQTLTTPTVTTDLTTSALPTISPTIPTVVKKKLAHRRPVTTTAALNTRPETTTQFIAQEDLNKESPIMKISNRPHLPKLTYDYKNDYSHKQDEKDTPTSDVAVSLSDTLKSTVESEQDFSFHKDFKPMEVNLEPVTSTQRETTTTKEEIEFTTTPRSEITTTVRPQRTRLRNKFNRTRFNVKDYKNRLSSTTSTTEKPAENTPKIRFPQRRLPYSDIENETTTERRKFAPKDPRHKIGSTTEINEQIEKEIHSFKPSRQRQTTVENIETTTAKLSSRIRNGQRRPRPPPEDTTEITSYTTIRSKRPLRKKIKDSEMGESIQDIVTETTIYENNDITSERTRSESAIMKIADKKHQDHLEHLFEHSKRVSDLTLAASKDYNKPGMFKTVSSNSRRIPNYFTIATEDPILPIEAFFPQLNQRKDA